MSNNSQSGFYANEKESGSDGTDIIPGLFGGLQEVSKEAFMAHVYDNTLDVHPYVMGRAPQTYQEWRLVRERHRDDRLIGRTIGNRYALVKAGAA